MHPFEKEKLGKPPYRVTGVEVKVGPIRQVQPNGLVLEIGAPGQPMGCCQYCSTGIKYCYWIESADGNTFYTGSECVLKAAKEGRDNALKQQVNRMLTAEKNEKADQRIEAAQQAIVEDQELRDRLEAVEVNGHFKQSQLQQINWFMKNAGRAGKLKMARIIEKYQKGVDHA